ncbi:hypothetical protein ABEF93_000844 [Exophiala dermatitidis]
MLTIPSYHTQWASPLLGVLTILLLSSSAQGLDISYCSSQNTAGSYPAYYSIYQSNGACETHCQGSYAFAILQGYNCWCSNYVPASQEDTGSCSQTCPGYPSDLCGSTENDTYGYYLLSGAVPAGTAGASSSNTANTKTRTATATATSSQLVSTSLADPGSSFPASGVRTTSSPSSPAVIMAGSSETSEEATSVTYYSSDFSTSSTSPPTTSSPTSTSSTSSDTSTTPSPTSSPTPTEVYTSVTTVTGEVRTVVITPPSSTDATLGQSSTGGGGVSTGKVVGIVLGVALGIGALIGIGVWLWFRRRHQRMQMQAGPDATFIPRTGETSPSNNIPSRQVSQLSSSGLLGNKTPRINTSGMPPGNDLRSADTTVSAPFDRRSLATDQRLNPYALYIHDESRLSNVSLQDNQDYSRQLRVANPD